MPRHQSVSPVYTQEGRRDLHLTIPTGLSDMYLHFDGTWLLLTSDAAEANRSLVEVGDAWEVGAYRSDSTMIRGSARGSPTLVRPVRVPLEV